LGLQSAGRPQAHILYPQSHRTIVVAGLKTRSRVLKLTYLTPTCPDPRSLRAAASFIAQTGKGLDYRLEDTHYLVTKLVYLWRMPDKSLGQCKDSASGCSPGLATKGPIRLLNGGIQAWRAQNLPLAKGVEKSIPPKARYQYELKPQYIVSTEDVQNNKGAYTLIDTRSTFEWIKGKIPAPSISPGRSSTPARTATRSRRRS